MAILKPTDSIDVVSTPKWKIYMLIFAAIACLVVLVVVLFKGQRKNFIDPATIKKEQPTEPAPVVVPNTEVPLLTTDAQ